MQSDPTTIQPMCDDTIALEEERKDKATTALKDTGSASKESKDLLLAESNDRYVLFPIKDKRLTCRTTPRTGTTV